MAHSSDGPLEVVINVLLPLYAEDIELSASPYGFYSQISAYGQMRFCPEILKLENSCLVKCFKRKVVCC
jgi:hypothetical protein